MTTIFRVIPKVFTTPSDPVGFTIEGVSARINSMDIGNQKTFPFSFIFYCKDKVTGAWIPKDGADLPVRVSVPVPGQVAVNMVSLLVSPNKLDKYKAAGIICASQGYQLLPIEQQDTLLDVT